MEQPLYTPRRLRVVCIGAGYAGLMLAYKWKHQPGMSDIVDLAIYEKNPDVGGTWFENRYPGVACDVRERRDGEWNETNCPYRFRHIYTPSRLSPIQTGPRSMPQDLRSGSISKERRSSITLTSVCVSIQRWRRQFGTMPRENGTSKSNAMEPSKRMRPTFLSTAQASSINGTGPKSRGFSLSKGN